MSLRAASTALLPALSRGAAQKCGLHTSSTAMKEAGSKSGMSHAEVVRGDGHHGLRPGYSYDWEHGPHYMNAAKVPNFHKKWNIIMPSMFAVALAIPAFAVWWQQSKMKQ